MASDITALMLACGVFDKKRPAFGGLPPPDPFGAMIGALAAVVLAGFAAGLIYLL